MEVPRPVGPPWWRPGMQVTGVVILALGFVIGYFVQNGRPTPAFDLTVLRWFEHVRVGWMVTLGRWIEFWDGPTATPWLLLLVGILIIVRGHRTLGLITILFVALAWFPGHVAKSMFPRDRPPKSVSPEWIVSGANSFPSGHTGFITSVLVVGLFVLTALGHRRRWWGVLFFVLLVLVACSRMLVGVHYPTDVVGGSLLALGAGLIMWPIFAGLLYTVPSHVHWLRDTREPAVNRGAAPVRELSES
jgi:undecaprenyl-diphosphatase